jgi:Domain of unknown function (DUF3854)
VRSPPDASPPGDEFVYRASDQTTGQGDHRHGTAHDLAECAIGSVSGYGMGVFPQHAQLLEGSAISVKVARARGYISVDTKTRFADTGIAKAGQSVPGLLIPIHDVAGVVKLYQYRPDRPRLNGSGKPIKYETSVGRGLVVDVPPPIRNRISDPTLPLWITEGARKADAAVSAGLCCVAILGTYGWRGSNGQGGKTALACWESIALNGRDVYLCFDSDVMTKREVGQALDRLGQFLGSRGANVQFVYLPDGTSESVATNGGFSRDGAKVGLDDYLAAGHGVDDLLALATTERRPGLSTPPESPRNTATPTPEPPELASDQRILDRFKVAVRRCGVVGEERNAQRLYLLITSRVLDKPVSAAVKGHSSSGKSFTTETTVRFFPPEAVIEMTAMSERALVYSKEDYQHRTLVLYEAVALREGNDDNLTSYFVRSLLSEGRIEYPVTVRDETGNFTTKTVVKEGPTNMIVTTTKTRMHAENETRVMSLTTDDSKEQTARVLMALADESDNSVNFAEWHQLQAWLQHAEHRVTIPYARTLAEQIPPVAVRLRRDFGALLAMIRAHAILHQQTRDRDPDGRIIATIHDYEVVRDLMAEVIAEGVGSTVSPVVRETVAAVEALAGPDGVKLQLIAHRLDVDKSNASRRLRVAADGGYVTNLEDKRGKPGRWVVGDPLPDEHDLLPQLRNTSQPSDQECCGVAPDPEGENGQDPDPDLDAVIDQLEEEFGQVDPIDDTPGLGACHCGHRFVFGPRRQHSTS